MDCGEKTDIPMKLNITLSSIEVGKEVHQSSTSAQLMISLAALLDKINVIVRTKYSDLSAIKVHDVGL